MEPSNPYEYRCACGDTMGLPRAYAGRLVICPKCAAPVITPKSRGEFAVKVDGEKVILSERLSIQIARPTDWIDLLPITSDEENFRFELSPPDSRAGLIKSLKRRRFPAGFRKHFKLMFIVRKKNHDSTTMGLVHLQLNPACFSGYLGLMIHHPFQGSGYGTEATREIVRFGFRHLGLHRMESSCDSENRACIRVLEKNGFTHEGTTKHGAFHLDRGWVDIPTYAQLNPAEEP